MWRSFFLALGAYCCLLGVEALALEKAVLKPDTNLYNSGRTEIVPFEGAPWILLGTGAVVMLYSFTIPQKLNGG